jgi:hypothetical protein
MDRQAATEDTQAMDDETKINEEYRTFLACYYILSLYELKAHYTLVNG